MSKFEFDLMMKETSLVTNLFKEHGLVATEVAGSSYVICGICGDPVYMRVEGSNFRFAQLYCRTHFKEFCKAINKR